MFSNWIKATTLIALVAVACLALPLVGTGGNVAARQQGDEAQRVGQAWCDAWNSLDVARFSTAFTDDIFYEDVPAGITSHNTAEVRDYAQSYFTAIPDFHFDCFNAFLSDGHGSIEWNGSGTDDIHTGFTKTGKLFSVRGVSVIEVRDGKISRSVDYYDLATTMRQEGLIP